MKFSDADLKEDLVYSTTISGNEISAQYLPSHTIPLKIMLKFVLINHM